MTQVLGVCSKCGKKLERHVAAGETVICYDCKKMAERDEQRRNTESDDDSITTPLLVAGLASGFTSTIEPAEASPSTPDFGGAGGDSGGAGASDSWSGGSDSGGDVGGSSSGGGSDS
jgi:uncharacterized membrane protein